MRAMVLEAPGAPLQLRELPLPRPLEGQALVRVVACGVCRTDLHVIDGELADPKLPLVPGHEVVGVVETSAGGSLAIGARVGIPWLGWTCGACGFCSSGRENLCAQARFTGYQLDGGYAAYALADERYCFPLPARFDDAEAAPLLCAGLIGHRALRMAGDARRVGLYGFGAAAHLIAQVAAFEGREVFAFTRPGDAPAQRLALELGARWAGSSLEMPPAPLDAAVIFAPVGALVPLALRAVERGGIVICAGIHMSEIPAFPYELLWGERTVRSVANLTRRDATEFLELAGRVPLRIQITRWPLEQANQALAALREGRLVGAAVLMIRVHPTDADFR